MSSHHIAMLITTNFIRDGLAVRSVSAQREKISFIVQTSPPAAARSSPNLEQGHARPRIFVCKGAKKQNRINTKTQCASGELSCGGQRSRAYAPRRLSKFRPRGAMVKVHDEASLRQNIIWRKDVGQYPDSIEMSATSFLVDFVFPICYDVYIFCSTRRMP